MASPNPFNLLNPPHLQQRFLWADLAARRTKRQEPRLYWRGRGIGGSTAVNGQIAIRGVLPAFDDWAELGCEGWSAEHVLPYFNGLEDDLALGDEPWHGKGGPIPVYRAPLESWGPVDLALRDAALALGHPWCDDLNAPDADGRVHLRHQQSRDGRRVSTNDGYLEPARGRPNLAILGDAWSTRCCSRAGAPPACACVGTARCRISTRRRWSSSAGAFHSPADPDALGHRPGRASEDARHRGGRGPAGRRRVLRPSLSSASSSS